MVLELKEPDSGYRSVIEAFGRQIVRCRQSGSPFTARLLTVALEEFKRGGELFDLLSAWDGEPGGGNLPLRLAAALHALVLMGRAADLSACWPPDRAAGEPQLACAVRQSLGENREFVRRILASVPQTNDVGRSAVLLGGFLHIASEVGLPLRLLEIGASAGLNLIWDRYRYDLGGVTWGDPASDVRLTPEWHGPLPPTSAAIAVVERAGCDLAPVDLDAPMERLRLRSFIWADQPGRLDRLDGAIRCAREMRVTVQKADAAAWLRPRLEAKAEGRVTVLYHSIVWQYLSLDKQNEIGAIVAAAGSAATSAAPLAWLRFERLRPGGRAELRLRRWPGGEDQLLAVAQPHGSSIEWGMPSL